MVIDFEATCDEGKNPHPQEIIEFPSVIMNSQLEACFQTYVRPTCNQILSDFWDSANSGLSGSILLVLSLFFFFFDRLHASTLLVIFILQSNLLTQ